MKIVDIDKAERLDTQSKRDLKAILKLSWDPKARSQYTTHEIKAEHRILEFIEQGIII